MVRPLCAGWIVVMGLMSCAPAAVFAAKPSDSLLPTTTKGYLSIPDVGRLADQFNRSQFGQLANDPLMKPFVEDFKRQLRQQGMKQLEQLGLSWEELEDVPTGEVALAVIQLSADESAVALVVDVTSHAEQADALLAKVAERMARNGAKRLRRSGGDPLIAYQLAAEPGRKLPPTAAYFLQRDMLVASDNIPVLESMHRALTGERTASLSQVRAYHEIMSQCAAAADGMPPNVRWFIEPFGYAEALRAAAPLRERRKGPDLLKVFRNQGFTAIQGVGGFVNFSAGKYELLHRTVIYAPPISGRDPQGKDKYSLAARMLRFPAGGDLLPQSWVPRDVATYTTLNWDMRWAFATSESLVDELIGEKGVFRDVLDSLRDDPDGPRVDIEKNLVAHLGNRATMITDNVAPIGPKCERKVLAAEVTDESTVAATIRKLMESDKDARRRDFEGHVIWEIVDAQCEAPTLEVETPGVNVRHSESDAPNRRNPREDRLLATSAVCVAHGHLFLASHIELLQQVLLQTKQTSGLGAADDFRMIAAQARALGVGPISFRVFSRTDEEFRPTYELVRTGQMPQSETILGKLLNSVLGEGKEGVPRKQRIDGHELPEFDAIRRYLGPAGTFISSRDDGWLCTGFMLTRKPLVVEGPATSDAIKAKAEADPQPAEVGKRNAEEAWLRRNLLR